MTVTRIYCPEKLLPNTRVVLSEASSHHLITVLRIALGASIIIFDGSGLEYSAQVENIIKKSLRIRILHAVRVPVDYSESPLFVHLVQGISRGDRMDYAIQKSVELGVSEITPIITERCNVPGSALHLNKRIQHWQGIIIAACEQSGRVRIPTLNPILSIKNWIDNLLIKPEIKQNLICIATPDTSHRYDYKIRSAPKQVHLLIGPEGGFTETEVKSVQQIGGLSLRLGPRILRTETATVVGLACVQMLWGDLL